MKQSPAVKHYIDAKNLTFLFVDRVANYGRICNELKLLAENIVNRFKRRSDSDYEDAVSDATLTAISKIGKFNVDRDNANAFSYFTTVIFHSMLKFLKNAKRKSDFEISLSR